jgi:hypothetical protein
MRQWDVEMHYCTALNETDLMKLGKYGTKRFETEPIIETKLQKKNMPKLSISIGTIYGWPRGGRVSQ